MVMQDIQIVMGELIDDEKGFRVRSERLFLHWTAPVP